jgi:methyltransferase (TIGR00027 family)
VRLPFVPTELHRSERPSATAEAVALMRAVENRRPERERIVSDPFAHLFLSRRTHRLVGPAASVRPVRDLIARNAIGSVETFVLCRHRFIDEHLAAALQLGPDTAEQVVILGAGYDSRAYRFERALSGRSVYEVDLPPLSRLKASIVARFPMIFGPTAINRVEIDFRRQRLADQLDAAGFEPGRRTFVVWEGVAPYLTEAAVTDTLDSLAALCGKGSTLTFDMWDGKGGADHLAPVRRLGARAIALVGEPVTFGRTPERAADLLARHGFSTVDVADGAELTFRYSTSRRKVLESVYAVAARI